MMPREAVMTQGNAIRPEFVEVGHSNNGRRVQFQAPNGEKVSLSPKQARDLGLQLITFAATAGKNKVA